ncbi:MAG TPA: hypothetical protein VKH42_18580 [Vicinamibacterales bacterium]|nr:hypothetical protein [Vicinamibacterales bacterium]
MRAARAFAWEFGRGHRLTLVVLAAYMFGFWAIRLVIVGPGHPIKVAPPDGLAAFLVVPATFAAFYFIGVFTFGLSGDLAARESIFPRRMFTLPLTSAALAGWPMAYGCASMAALWLVVAAVSRLVGADVTVPWIWPMLFGAAVIAWMQALTWMPYGIRGLRVVIAVMVLTAIDATVFVALDSHVADATLFALLAPQLPVAYLVAWYGVARARRGDTPNWDRAPSGERVRPAEASRPAADGSRSFRSADHAQTWFEWRCHGRVLPAMTALVVPVELLLFFVPGNDTAAIVFLVLFVALLTPPFLAVFVAPALGTPGPYLARRPLTSARLVAAKLTMTVWSTLAAWLLVAVFVIGALLLSGRMPIVVERLQTGSHVTGALRMFAVCAAAVVALIASTWKHLVQSLCIGLTGRDWLIKGSVLAALIVLVALWPLVDAILFDMRVQSIVWNALPWILAAMVAMKMVAGVWVAIRLHDSRLLGDGALVLGAVCWTTTITAMYGVLVWFADSPAIPRYLLGAIAILNVPLARVAAAPLALEWSRHQ